MRRALMAVGLTAGLALTAGAVATEERSATAGHPMIGVQAPTFELENVHGGSVSLLGLRGNYLVIHFGASW